MLIEHRPHPALSIALRLAWLCLLPFLAEGRAAEAALPELAAALKNFRPDPPRGWSYTQTTSAEGKSTVERYDATKPEFDRWTLQQKDGARPDPEATRQYAETRSRRSRGGTAPKLAEQLDLATAELISRTGDDAIYRCRLKPAEAGDKTSAHLRATVVLHGPTATIARIELRNQESFSPAFGVKITELCTTLTYSVPAGDTPSLPQRVDTVIRGTAFWFKRLDAELAVRFTDYVRASKR
jgi:hypothetical protein